MWLSIGRSMGGEDKVMEQQVRTYPKAMMMLCAIMSISNPLLAPAILYLLFKSNRSWSKSKYSSTYRHVNKAAAVTIIGILITGTTLIVGVILFRTFKGENTLRQGTAKNRTTVTSTNNSLSFHINTTEQEIEHVTLKHTTGQSDNASHIADIFRNVARFNIEKTYINKTHLLIENKDTKKKKIAKIPSLFQKGNRD